MLAIISDLHFCDRTALRNVDPAAFRNTLADISGNAGWIAKKLDRPIDLDLVLLGDVFDLLRTERWFDVPVAERPWGSAAALDGEKPSPAVIAHAHRILDDILSENASALATLAGTDAAQAPGVTVRRIFLPGNHDRLALHDEGLYARMRAAIGASDERALAHDGVYPHRLQMPRYGLLARHGHEWDPWNFEAFEESGHAQYEDDKYLRMPIGDPITTELVARLPHEVARLLADVKILAQEEKDEINTRLQHIEDVRPLLASLSWVFHETERLRGVYAPAKAEAVRVAVDAAVQTLARDFLQLDFYRAWHERHSAGFHPFGKASELKLALEALSAVSVSTLGRVGFLLDRLAGSRDENLEGAKVEDLACVGAKDLRFVVYGHTHDAEMVALHARGPAEDLYLNTGTFRQRVFQTDDKQGFIASDYMTHLYFCDEAEAASWRDPRDKLTGPAYTAWTGTRNR